MGVADVYYIKEGAITIGLYAESRESIGHQSATGRSAR